MAALTRLGPLAVAGGLALCVAALALASPGDLDPTFGVNGKVVLSPALESYASGAAVQSDGKVLLAGTADDVPHPPPPPPAPWRPDISGPDFLAVRLTPNGELDPTFGTNGAVRTPIGPGAQVVSSGARTVAVATNGTVVLGGFTVTGQGTDFAFTRYTPSGALDPSFSDDGIQTVHVGQFGGADAVAVQPDGKIIAVGSGGSGFTVLRLLANGRLDSSFGTGGVVNTVLSDPSREDLASALLLRGGKIVVAGTADLGYPSTSGFALARYLSDGRLDRSFGSRGIAVTRGAGQERATAVAAAPGGKLVVAGAGGARYQVARYLPDGKLDRTFGGRGFVSTPFQGLAAVAHGVRVQADGKVVAAGVGHSDARSAFTVARYRVDGVLDSSFGAGGRGVYDMPPTRVWGAGVAIQPSGDPARAGRLVVAGSFFDAGSDHIAAVGVDLGVPGPAPPTPKKCRVPRVLHLSYGRARRKIRRAGCEVGRIRSVRRPRFAGLVVAQSPRPGRVLPPRGRVNLVLSRKFY